jgi:glutamyl-tRNA synthetase
LRDAAGQGVPLAPIQAASPRVRFAPSPTGYLHVGGARTALFNWLFARSRGGVFVLRIEDTDRERSSPEMTAAILDGMQWLGLYWDEGPFHQADGLERHREDALALLAQGHAYRCFCSAQRLAAERDRAAALGTGWRYDRRCLAVAGDEAERRAAAAEPHTIRFRVPDGTTAWDDAVHGTTSFANADLDDFIVLRSDGTPIYNLAVVSDDIAMRITHVIRGDDHLSNTPKQILLYRALGHAPPVFGHVPMILGPDGRRLSKRHGATSIGEYRDRGFLPEALINFLALLGWNPDTEEEILTRAELVARFSLEGINLKSAVFDTAKLEWMNGRYLAGLSAAALEDRVAEGLGRMGLAVADADGDAWLRSVIDLAKVRARSISEIVEHARMLLADPVEYDAEAVGRHWRDAGVTAERLATLRARLADLDAWDAPLLEAAVRGLADELGVGAGKVIHPLRVAVTGKAASAGIFDVLTLLGRERALRRLAVAEAILLERIATEESEGGTGGGAAGAETRPHPS